MSICIIKLPITQNEEEINIFCKKNESYNLKSFLKKINLETDSYKELYKWDLDNKKTLLLIGSNDESNEENMNKLPISDEYQFYGDLYCVCLNNNKYTNLDIENFENIYHALYSNLENLETDEEIYSSEEENINSIDIDDEENFMEDYGDNSEDESYDENDNEIDNEDKKKKLIRKKKIIKIKEQETKDIIYEEKEIKELKNETRVKCLNILYSIIDDITEEQKLYFREVERNIFNFCFKKSIERNILPTWNILIKNIYINKIMSIYTNLVKNNYVKNNRLLKRLIKKEFTPEQLVNMTPQDMFPENWKELIDEKYRREKILYETKKEAMTDQFKCSKCKSRETAYFEMQTRSADEPMTIFITCLNCGKRWKN